MKTSWVVFCFWFLLHFLLCCSSELQVETIDVNKAKELLESGYVYIDVRTEEEFKSGHVDVEKIFNIPYLFFTEEGSMKNSKFLEQIQSSFNKNDQIVVGCRSGARSMKGALHLHENGFKHVYNMGGGYLAWEESGLPIKKQKDSEL